MKEWIAAVVAVEAVVEIVISSDLFLTFRAWVTKVNPGFLGKLFACGYCLSVWVAAVAAIFIPGQITGDPIPDMVLKWLVLHRVSNAHHELLSRYFKRLPLVVVFNFVKDPGFTPQDKVYEVTEKQEGE
jgi:hypothetical protein